MIKFSLSIFFIFVIFCSFPKFVFASAPQIIASPSGTIQLDQSFTINATMSGLSKNAIYRLRVAIAQPGTTDYFGATFDGSTWHTGSIASGNYVSITTDANGTWFGSILGKVDPDDPNFTTGSGVYDLKIGRYTQTGSTATWSDPVAITIYVPPSTPVPQTPIPTKVPTPIPTKKVPTSIPQSTSITKKSISYDATTPAITASLSAEMEDILGTQSSFIASPTPHLKIAGETSVNHSVIFLLLGSIIVLAAGGLSGWIIYVGKKGRDIFYRIKS